MQIIQKLHVVWKAVAGEQGDNIQLFTGMEILWSASPRKDKPVAAKLNLKN
jgi:hypothetical protein